jgi:hypothetical protein
MVRSMTDHPKYFSKMGYKICSATPGTLGSAYVVFTTINPLHISVGVLWFIYLPSLVRFLPDPAGSEKNYT